MSSEMVYIQTRMSVKNKLLDKVQESTEGSVKDIFQKTITSDETVELANAYMHKQHAKLEKDMAIIEDGITVCEEDLLYLEHESDGYTYRREKKRLQKRLKELEYKQTIFDRAYYSFWDEARHAGDIIEEVENESRKRLRIVV